MIEKLNTHYSMTNPASVYDEEALTALELAGRTTAKVNEVVEAQNTLASQTVETLENQTKTIDDRMDLQDLAIANIRSVTVPADVTAEVKKQIKNGTFDTQIEEHLGNLEERLDNLLTTPVEGAVVGEEVIDVRTRNNGLTYDNAGQATRAIDEDLQRTKESTSGYVVGHELMQDLRYWGNGNSIVGDSNYVISENTLTWTIPPAQAITNPGVATRPFTWGDGKLYLLMDVECNRDVLLTLYGANTCGYTSGNQQSKGNIIKSGRHLYAFDKSDFTTITNGVQCLWFVHDGGKATENTYVYTIKELRVFQNPLLDLGFKGENVKDFLIDLRNHTDTSTNELFNTISDATGNNQLFYDYADLNKWGALDHVINVTDNSVSWSTLGDKGVTLHLENVDPTMLVRIEFDVEIVTENSEYMLDLNLAKSHATADGYSNVLNITESGHYSFSFDPAYYSVYVREINYIWLLSHCGTGSHTTTIKNLKVWQNKLEDNGLPTSLADAILQIDNGGVVVNNPDYLIAPDGSKYVAQVDADGVFRAVPTVPGKTLYLGNSLLLGFGHFGMAASEITKDYYYLMNEAIKAKKPTHTASRTQASEWEGLTSIDEKNAYLTNTLLPHLSEDLELVIVQLGDNVNTAEKKAVFAESAIDLLSFIRSHCPKARVAWMGAWYQSAEKQAQMINACQKTGSVFINIWDLAVAENRSAVGNTYTLPDGTVKTIDSDGVASHPGDAGFKAIANRALYVLGITDTENYYE